ncbi:EAL domain-containing protein [Radiobacillus sp. PE A8.2]|uniref:sensor domain-containing protein n=1 Tax=Radiobacillus sp. PE A8.2 TaxID=3380349 RepID=UPI003890F087
MTLLNLDSAFDRTTLNQLFQQLETDVPMTAKQISKMKSFISEQFNIFHELKYAIAQSTTITITNKNGVITYVDDNFCKLTGYSKEELLHQSHRLLNSGFHNRSFYKELWETILAGDVWEGDIRNQKKDGSYFWVKTTIVPLLGEEQGITAFVAFRTDITEKKEIEEKLFDAINNDYRRILSNLANYVFKVEKDKQTHEYYYPMVEGQLAEKIGFTTELVEGKNLLQLHGMEGSQFLQAKYDEAFTGKEVSMKFKIKDYFLYAAISPIVESNKVVHLIGTVMDITSLEKAEKQVEYLAYYDTLTNLPNRSKLKEELDQYIRKTNNQPFAILYCDLDRLNYVNDMSGQSAGDQVIKLIGKRIQKLMSDSIKLYHFGGDEYIIVVYKNASKAELTQLLSSVQSEVKRPIVVDGDELFVTCSIGISRSHKDGFSINKLINYASIALHYCKVSGRNNYLFYSTRMNEAYNELLLLELDLRKALNNDEFILYYQPKVDVNSGDIVGFEALIRWFHQEKGFIPPDRFIPLAEEIGLIHSIGEWVIRQACRQHQLWFEEYGTRYSIAVNVSAIELQRSDFLIKVKRIIDETNMSPEWLELEITENSVMQNTEECIQTMNDLREMGISLSIDDFGTGYSSFGYLRKFPINHLKIDQSFIKNVEKEEQSAEIVKAVIQLGHTFAIKVIAEGVEDTAVLHFLQQFDCDYYQGYLFSRPLPPEQLVNVMKTNTYI